MANNFDIKKQIISCDLKLPSHILFHSKNIDNPTLEEKLKTMGSCGEKRISIIANIIKGISGQIPSLYLEQALKPHNVRLLTKNKEVEIYSFNEFIKKHLIHLGVHYPQKLKHDISISKTIMSDSIKVMLTTSKLKGEFTFNENSKNIKKIEFNFDYTSKKNLLVATEDLYPYSSHIVPDKNIIKKEVETWKSEENDFFEADKDIVDFELSRIVKKNNPLRNKSLKLKTVIQVGRLTPVILMTNGLEITTTGTSMRQGKVGDVIEVKLKNKKIVRGVIKRGIEYYVKI